MNRAITLYIGEVRADIPDESLVLMNYALANLTNPAVQKNSWSQGVTLPRTPANDAIFGEAFRLDRNAGAGGTGAAFSASRKTSFTIYASSGEILAAGYCKLNSVTRDGYEVQLFGGLGELVYNLSYDADGNKRSLASLDYGVDLDFTITKRAVLDAWSKLSSGYANILPSATTPNRTLFDDGSLVYTGNANRYVSAFAVGENRVCRVDCRRLTYVRERGIVALDSNGTAIAEWIPASTVETIIDYEIITPAGTASLLVQGETGTVTAAVRDYGPSIWDIINFAPCYNGIPGNDFSPDKAIATPASVGLPATKTGGYDAANTGGYTLVNLPEGVDEWAVKDFRSYLQRPVLNVWKMLQALADPVNNGGWTIDLTDINTTAKWPYRDMWLTRPLLPSLGTYKKEAGVASISWYSPWTTGNILIDYGISGAPANSTIHAKMTFKPTFDIDDAGGEATLKAAANIGGYLVQLVTFLQPIAYDINNLKVGAGKSVALYKGTDSLAAYDVAQMCGYTPDGANTEIAPAVESADYSLVSTDTYASDAAVTLECEAVNIDHIEVKVTHYILTTRSDGTKVLAVSGARLYHGINIYTPDQQCASSHTGTATTTSGATLRSGSRVTKEMLLTTGGTPADYLLSICKMFGLYLLTDGATKTAKILRRTSLYVNETLDLSERIDRSREMELVPLAFDAKWYDWKLAGSGGAFEKEYEDAEGVQYGTQRVDTNYDFDAQAKDILQGAVLKSCAAIMASGKYFAHAVNGGQYSPGVLLYSGATQTLWDASGNGEDFPCPVAPSAGIVYDNPAFPFYDRALEGRPEFRDKDGKGTDGADVLLLYTGVESYAQGKVSDDTSAMTALNGGTPCWLLDPGLGLDVPTFTRYNIADKIYLDFGTPRQIALLSFDYKNGQTIYAKAWKSFIEDRLDASGKVLRCRVRLDGLQVGTELLRKFYWYGGSLWVINSISNYSLTTFDPAEVELVQVRDKDAYLNGQY